MIDWSIMINHSLGLCKHYIYLNFFHLTFSVFYVFYYYALGVWYNTVHNHVFNNIYFKQNELLIKTKYLVTRISVSSSLGSSLRRRIRASISWTTSFTTPSSRRRTCCLPPSMPRRTHLQVCFLISLRECIFCLMLMLRSCDCPPSITWCALSTMSSDDFYS